MAVPTNAILRVVASMLMPDSVIAQLVFNVLFEADGSSTDEQDVVDDLADWVEDMITNLAGNIANDLTSSDVKVYVYDSGDDDWDEVGTANWAVTFTNTAEMLPHGIAAVVHARTEDPDVQGTKFIPGLTETTQNESDLEAGPITQLALFGVDWVSPFTGSATGSGFIPGVWSVAQTAFKAANLEIVVNLQVGYQRRRKPGVGI